MLREVKNGNIDNILILLYGAQCFLHQTHHPLTILNQSTVFSICWYAVSLCLCVIFLKPYQSFKKVSFMDIISPQT